MYCEDDSRVPGEWFALAWDGTLHSLGHLPNFDEADAEADRRNLHAIWIANEAMARQWAECVKTTLSDDPAEVSETIYVRYVLYGIAQRNNGKLRRVSYQFENLNTAKAWMKAQKDDPTTRWTRIDRVTTATTTVRKYADA